MSKLKPQSFGQSLRNHAHGKYLLSQDKDTCLSWFERNVVYRWCIYVAKPALEERRKKEEEVRKAKEEKAALERQRLEEEKRIQEEKRLEQFRYNEKNKHPIDSWLSFDKANRTYIVHGRLLESVSSLVSNCFPKFDAQKYAQVTAARNGCTVHEVLDMWERKGKESRDAGTLMHEKIEKYYQGVSSPIDDTFRLFLKFTERIKLRPYRTEWSVCDHKSMIAGTIDFVDYQNGEYSIYDWKRSEKVIANGLPMKINKYGEKANYPLGHLDNSPYYHYALQLSLYKYILEKFYNIKVSHLRLGIFHPSYDKPYLLEMPYLEEEVNTLLKLRQEIIM